MRRSNNNISKFGKLCISEDELIPGLPNDIALECFLRVPITSHPTLRLVSDLWNSTISHPLFFSLRRHASLAEHLVFLIQPPLSPPAQQAVAQKGKAGEYEADRVISQGTLFYNLSVYNFGDKVWRSFANITIPTFAQCVVLQNVGMVIVLGGWDPATLEPVPRVLVIDLARGVWREGSPMLTARSFFACAVVGPSTVYVAGGHDGQKNALRTALAYDVMADQWRELPNMMEERDECHGLVLNGDSEFWVISGYGTENQGRFRSDAEIYDPETNTWSRRDGVWPYPGHTPKSTAVVLQQQWISTINREAKTFDFKDNSWKPINLGSIPKSVSGSSSISFVEMGDDKVMVTGNGEECKEEGCGGGGVFMVEKTNKNGIHFNWQHLHAPPTYLGFPFCASHLFI